MIPFWLIGGTMSHIVSISVDDIIVAVTLVGGLTGTAVNKMKNYLTNVCEKLKIITISISFLCYFITKRPLPHTGVGSDRYRVIDKLFQVH